MTTTPTLRFPKSTSGVITVETEYVSCDDIGWSGEDLENAVRAECEKRGLDPAHVEAGEDRNGNYTYATVTL